MKIMVPYRAPRCHSDPRVKTRSLFFSSVVFICFSPRGSRLFCIKHCRLVCSAGFSLNFQITLRVLGTDDKQSWVAASSRAGGRSPLFQLAIFRTRHERAIRRHLMAGAASIEVGADGERSWVKASQAGRYPPKFQWAVFQNQPAGEAPELQAAFSLEKIGRYCQVASESCVRYGRSRD